MKLILMVGLPGSGKSTYIQRNLKGYKIISFDNYLTENIDSDYNQAWEKYQALTASEKTDIYLSIDTEFLKAVEQGKDIVVDFTNLTILERKKWFDLVDKRYTKQIIYMDTPKEIIYNRNINRVSKTIPQVVIDDMFEKLEPPLFKDKPYFREKFDFLQIISK